MKATNIIDAHQSTPSHIQRYINNILRQKLTWKPLKGGTTHQLFLACSKANQQPRYVLRINPTKQQLIGADAQQETQLLTLITGYNWSPDNLLSDTLVNAQLMPYYDPLGDALTRQHQQQLRDIVYAYQSIDYPEHTVRHLDYLQLMDDYKQLAEQALSKTVAMKEQPVYDWIDTFKQQLKQLPLVDSCLVHHDIHLGNLYLCPQPDTQTQTIKLLDWEYAGWGNPWFDAHALLALGLASQQVKSLSPFKGLSETQWQQGQLAIQQVVRQLDALWYWHYDMSHSSQ